jgi:hypothetical protein
MSETQIRLTRAELYEKVWAAPMGAVAKKLAISPWDLSKACRRHNIPIPPFGYWARIAVGHKVTPPALIPDSGGQETVEIYIREWPGPKLPVPAAEATRKVEIPDVLSHPLILKMEELLASARENDRNLIVPNPGRSPYLLVSRQQLPRALRILNALFQALENGGHTVSWLPDDQVALTVSVEGESVAFSLRELIKRVPHVLTRAEKRDPRWAPRWDNELTGRLCLSIDSLRYDSESIRASWTDAKIQTLENCLGDFLVRIRDASGAIKWNRLDREECDRHYEKVCKRLEAWQRIARERKRKAKVIGGFIERWEEAQRVRRFIKAVSERIVQSELSDERRRNVQQLLDWSTEYAASLDPLSDLPGLIDEFVPSDGEC